MQPQSPKSIGGALVDVFDAALSLVKTELRSLSRRVGNIIKAKGIGVVLLLASVVPLSLALIFLILFVFYGLMRLGLGAWAASLIIAVVSLAATGLLILLGIRRLTAEVKDDPESPADDVKRAEKKLDKTETAFEMQTERGEKRVEKAERDVERAQTELGRADVTADREAARPSTNPSTNPGTNAAGSQSVETTRPETTRPETMRPETMRPETLYVEPRSTSRPATEDGIPVSTKPQLGDEEDRR